MLSLFTKFLSQNKKGRDLLDDQNVYGNIIIQILGKRCMRVWKSAMNCFVIDLCGGGGGYDANHNDHMV